MRVKRDYQRKNLSNPFFRSKPKGKRPHPRRFRLFLILALFIVLVAVWFFLAAPLWRLEKIEISGLTRSPADNLRQIIWNQTKERRFLFFRQDNIFLFDYRPAEKIVFSAFNFSGLEIKKKLPNRLQISVVERPIFFIFQEGSNIFYSSQDGYIIKELPVNDADRAQYPLLESQSSSSLLSGDNRLKLPSPYLSFLVDLRAKLAGYPDLPLEKFIATGEANTANVKFLNGPVVYFNINLPAADQLGRLELVKKEKIKDNFSKINYIDLRYGDRLFINPELK